MAYKQQALAALLHNGEKQVLPVSKAKLIEISQTASSANWYGKGTMDVEGALAYLLNKVNTDNETTLNAAKTYTGEQINALDTVGYGTAKVNNEPGTQYISYIWEENGLINAEASDLTASAVAYTSGKNVYNKIGEMDAAISAFAAGAELKVSYNGMDTTPGANYDVVIAADGREYTLTQGSKTIAKFNIEKDSFVKEGNVVRGHLENEGVYSGADAATVFTEGTNTDDTFFIHLTIGTSDANETHLYIPAESLVDVYDANNAGKNVTLTIDKTANTISAAINEGGVTATELASDAVTTVKILDGNVTYGKLNADVTSYLTKADTALQAADIKSGSANGTIAVKGADVAVTGLKAISYTGAASDVTVTTQANDALSTLASSVTGADIDDVQGALQTIATAVNTVKANAVTSVTGVEYTNDDNVAITITPTTSTKGDVTLGLTTNLGNVAMLHYEGHDLANDEGISNDFYTSLGLGQ